MKYNTADLSVRVEAAGIKALFRKAAAATALLSVKKKPATKLVLRKIRCSAPGIPELLHDFLNEILYIIYVKRRAVAGVTIDELDIERNTLAASINVTASRIAPADFKRELKSVTYHGLSVKNDNNKWAAEFVIDV